MKTKKNKLLYWVSLSLFLLSSIQILFAQNYSDTLDLKIGDIYEKSNFPGFAVGIVSKDEVLYQQGFGYADRATKTPFTEHTIENIGSISKTFIGIALMQLVEKGQLDLDTEINTILPFKIIHPRFPDQPITVRHLAKHSSGIVDTKHYNRKCYVLIDPYPSYEKEMDKGDRKYFKHLKDNIKIPISDFLKGYLTPKGDLYRKKNFGKTAPGVQYEYSNIGSAVASLVVEQISGQPYDEYVKENILKPLKMKASAWRFKDIDRTKHATLYFSNGQLVPKYTLITYPDGGLLSSCQDLSIYVQQMMQGYAKESDFLSIASFEEMMPIQKNGEGQVGIFWDISRKGRIGHSGGDPGIFTYIQFDPKTNLGLVFMTNVLPIEDEETLRNFKRIWGNMLKYSKSL